MPTEWVPRSSLRAGSCRGGLAACSVRRPASGALHRGCRPTGARDEAACERTVAARGQPGMQGKPAAGVTWQRPWNVRRGWLRDAQARGEKGGRRRGRGERDAGGGGNQSGHMERWPRRSIGARLATMRVARVDAWAYGGRREAGLALMDSARRRAMGAITVGPLAPDEIQVVRSTLVVFVEATRRDEIVGRVRRWHRLRFAGFANGPWRGLGKVQKPISAR